MMSDPVIIHPDDLTPDWWDDTPAEMDAAELPY